MRSARESVNLRGEVRWGMEKNGRGRGPVDDDVGGVGRHDDI